MKRFVTAGITASMASELVLASFFGSKSGKEVQKKKKWERGNTGEVTFNIVNFRKKRSLYQTGLRPHVRLAG